MSANAQALKHQLSGDHVSNYKICELVVGYVQFDGEASPLSLQVTTVCHHKNIFNLAQTPNGES